MTKDYSLRATYQDAGQPTLLKVCAADYQDSVSQAWQRLPQHRHSVVKDFEILTIENCGHVKKK